MRRGGGACSDSGFIFPCCAARGKLITFHNVISRNVGTGNLKESDLLRFLPTVEMTRCYSVKISPCGRNDTLLLL